MTINSVMNANADASSAATPSSRRFQLLLLLAINLFNYIDRYVLAAVLTRIGMEMLQGRADANAKLGALATVFLISYMVLSPIFGLLGDRFPRWKLIGVGVILWSLASGASGLAGDYWILLITRIFVGVGEAAYGPVAPTIISDLYPITSRGKVMSWFYMAIPVGSALGYTLGGIADAMLGWRWGFYLVVPPGVLLGLLCFWMKEPPRGDGQVSAGRRIRLADYLELARNPSYIWNTAAMTAMTFAIGGIATWMPHYIVEYRHAASLGSANTIFGAITVITGITATLLGGIAGDALRGRVRGSYFLVSGAALALGFPFVMAMMRVPFPAAWGLVFLAEFCLFFNTGPSNTALANVTRPQIRATAFAINILLIHALGDAISPPIIGYIADRSGGDLNAGFSAVAGVMLAGSACWLIGSRYLDRDTERVNQSVPVDAK